MQSNNIIKVLESEEAQSFIRRNINEDIAALALGYRDKGDFNITECLQLIKLYKKARKKLPLFWKKFLALDERSYAQCTSEAIARYKTTFLSGSSLLDLTGGLGVDSLFLSNTFNSLEVIEQNVELHNLAEFNNARLGVRNIKRICADASTYMESGNSQYDLIYIDPDRRSDFGRSVSLDHLSPNVLDLLPVLNQRAKEVYIKLSPLFDLHEVYRCFESVKCIYVLAEKGEIKEVGVRLNFSLKENSYEIRLRDVSTDFDQLVSMSSSVNPQSTLVDASYMHVPLALVSKSYSTTFFLKDMPFCKHPEYELYFSDNFQIVGFRSFEILQKSSLATKKVSKMLNNHGVKKCCIVVKGVNIQPNEWHRKLKTRDGGDVYLFILYSKTKEAVLARIIS